MGNAYAYAGNNPATNTDPLGMWSIYAPWTWGDPTPLGHSWYEWDSPQNNPGDFAIGAQNGLVGFADAVIPFLDIADPCNWEQQWGKQVGAWTLQAEFLVMDVGLTLDVVKLTGKVALLGVRGGIQLARSGATTTAKFIREVAETPLRASRTNGELVQEIARRAEVWGTRKGLPSAGGGPIQGTLKHNYAKRLLDKYQSRFGSRGLETEGSYKFNEATRYGEKGGVRFDVYDKTTGRIYDYKFTRHPYSNPAREKHLLNHAPYGAKDVEFIGPW